MHITFLGTSAGVPTRERNQSCVALRLPERGELWLLDCGEGTQHQLLQSDLKASQITRIFITHVHGDHVHGLPGLLASCGLAGDTRRIDLYGPPGLEDYLHAALTYSHTYVPYAVAVHTVSEGTILDDGGFTVRCAPLSHRVPTVGYRVTEHDRPAAFDATRAAALGIPPGPLYGELKRGARITLPDGREVDGAALRGAPERGRSLAYCTDTSYCAAAVDLARGVDLLVHEATFAARDAAMAGPSGHSTAVEAARVAREAGASRLVLTHVSARYAHEGEMSADGLLAEARAHFPATDLARDFLELEIPRRR